MKPHALPLLSRTALGVAFLSLSAAHTPALATPDFRVPVVVCPPGNPQTMAHELKLTTLGVVRQSGRNPPPRSYFCPVFNPDFTAGVPSWSRLKLVYADTTGLSGNITVRLYEKGVITKQIATVSSGSAVGLQTAASSIEKPLDFLRFSYYITVEMARPPFVTPDVVDVHEVQLTN